MLLAFVPGAGLEPARPQWSRDFKSLVSTNSTTRASDDFFKIKPSTLTEGFSRAKDEIRTRDPHLGKVMLYQLSYFRKRATKVIILFKPPNILARTY